MNSGFGIRGATFLVIAVIIVATGLTAPLLLQTSSTSTTQVTGTSTSTTTTNPQSANPPSSNLGSFKSYSQLQQFISANAKNVQQQRNNYLQVPGVTETMMVTMSAASISESSSAGAAQSPPTYTGTNVQVQGVDEPDTVKTDGLHIFVATSSSVTIINAFPPNSTKALSTLSYPNDQVLGIEISLNRLAVINQRNSNMTYIDLLLYDTTNLASPKLMENASIAGYYVAARLSQGYLYAVIQQPSYQYDNSGNLTGAMPILTENDVTNTLSPSSVFFTDNWAQISYYTMIVSMSMSTGKEHALAVLTGESSTIYVSTSNVYVVYAVSPEISVDGIPGDVYSGGVISANMIDGQNTTIFRASYLNGSVLMEAAGSVPGTILNQFSLDEYNGYFRVATSRFATIGGSATRSDDVYVLNSKLALVSSIQNIAPGENIYAVRFAGDQGYVVTFQQVDPLFVISFKDITKPVVQSALKVSGFSDYLHPLPGGYLIGVGKEAVPATDGNYSFYLGLKLSLFKVFANGTSVQISKYLIGVRGTNSPVLNDHLAFTYDPTKNITVIPVLLAKVSGTQTSDGGGFPLFGDYVWQGAYVLRVSQSGLTMLGNVSQYPPGLNYGDSAANNLNIYRSIIIGNYLYTISQGEVMVNALSNFSMVAKVPLAPS
ncbi:MAG: beta-propeller domain-containing protein [Thaumarchaeota archaeon]|nr:beta-propeller domain-containing protein [Nitrososphaerota archaeon]